LRTPIERNLEFCDLLGFGRGEAKTSLFIRTEVENKIQSMMNDAPKPWWIVHPGASRSKKQWGIQNYSKLSKRILENEKGTLILTGDSKERETCHAIETEVGVGHRIKNLSGTLKLDEFAALLKQSQLLISGDTGAYHIAMAVGTRSVTLFAPWDIGSSPAINGPYFNRDRHITVETSEIGKPISEIEVERVFEACLPFFRSYL
jgi:ADP-heptose:LPS heptosyltransferase